MVAFHEDYTALFPGASGPFGRDDGFRAGIVGDSPLGLLFFAHQVRQLAHLGMAAVPIVRVLNPNVQRFSVDVAATPLHPLPQQVLLAIGVHLEGGAFAPRIRRIQSFAVGDATMASLH